TLLPNGDVRGAVGREGLACPASPALAQRHPRDAGHEVELRWPYVAVGRRELLGLLARDPPVMRVQDLRGQVGVLVEADVRRLEGEHPRVLAGWQPPKVGHTDLHDETTARLEVRGRVGEAVDLLVLRGQVRDGVEDE